MNTTKRIYLLLTVCLIVIGMRGNAATVDTALTHSAAMNKDIKAVVITPDGYSKNKKFPVLYLLHGFSGNYSDWIKKVPAIGKLADEYQMIIVCADGAFAGWYYDSPVNNEWKYETYVGTELVSWVDKHYSTITNRAGRAITGLSMGGHGAIYLAIKHQDTFGAAGSMSGVLDIRPFADSFGIAQVLGKYSDKPAIWDQNTDVNLINQLKPNALSITFDCGYDDFTYKVNLAFHDKLLAQKIPHDFTVRAGSHTWEYWGNSINYQALFFSRFFNKQQ